MEAQAMRSNDCGWTRSLIPGPAHVLRLGYRLGPTQTRCASRRATLDASTPRRPSGVSRSPKDLIMRSTIVLVHGAFAESASWDGVIDPLRDAGHSVIAAANPLRGLAADADAVSDLVRTVNGPVVLVGHSYGGNVISNVDADTGEITGLVYVNAFVPEPGESALDLSGLFPGSTLADALQPVQRSDGTTDLYIAADRFHDQFCADVPAPQAARMAATQRPATLGAFQDPSGDRP